MNSWQMSTKMSTWTNVDKPLWIYLLRGGASPTRIVVSINHACFAVFAGSITVEIPSDLCTCCFQSKAIINTLNQPAIHTTNASPFLQPKEPILSWGEPVPSYHYPPRWASIKHLSQVILVAIQHPYRGWTLPELHPSLV
jgi:hypothetical protein